MESTDRKYSFRTVSLYGTSRDHDLPAGTIRGGDESISLSKLATRLAITEEPLRGLATLRFVQLYLYIHRVEGLASGVYRYWQEHAELEKIK